MKISILTLGIVIALIAGATFLTSCGSATTENGESTAQHDMENHSDHDEMASDEYACPIHPEITNKEGVKWLKSGISLVLNQA